MLKLKKADWILVIVILLVVGGYFGGKSLFDKTATYAAGSLEARITVNGKLYKQVPLTKQVQTIDMKTEYGTNTLKVFDNGIQMTESSAPRRIALDMGFISKPGERIICVPNRVLVEIVGGKEEKTPDGIDATVS